MSCSEFDIIERFFHWPGAQRPQVLLAVGDDAAELALDSRQRLLLDVSSACEGSEFQSDEDGAVVAHRLLAAAATGLAARGARPLAFTLALSLPDGESDWLRAFSRGLAACARTVDLALIGGDTTRGPRAVVLHLHGTLPADCDPVMPNGAGPGDLIYVGGRFGDAGLALLHRAGELQLVRVDRDTAYAAAHYPHPASSYGHALAGIASAARAITESPSKALAALLHASGCGGTVQVEQLPLGTALRNNFDRAGGWNIAWHGPAPATLCLTVPAAAQAHFEQRCAQLGVDCTWIGWVERAPGLRATLADGGEL